jgi:hypothetical protein
MYCFAAGVCLNRWVHDITNLSNSYSQHRENLRLKPVFVALTTGGCLCGQVLDPPWGWSGWGGYFVAGLSEGRQRSYSGILSVGH